MVRIFFLSSKYNESQGSGHQHTMLKSLLAEAQERDDVSFTALVPLTNKGGPKVIPLLPDWSERDSSRIDPSLGVNRDLLELSRQIGVGKAMLHVYEGGFRELLLVIHLLERSPNLCAEFNFNLTDPWHRTSAILERASWGELSERMSPLFPRLKLFAETERLGVSLRTKLNIPPQLMNLYPVFSAFNHPSNPPTSDRDFQFGFVVGNNKELALALISWVRIRRQNSKARGYILGRWGFSPTLPKRLRNWASVEILDAPLDDFAYIDLLAKTETLMLIYLSDYYEWSSSGRYLDGLVAGCRVVSIRDRGSPEHEKNPGRGLSVWSLLTKKGLSETMLEVGAFRSDFSDEFTPQWAFSNLCDRAKERLAELETSREGEKSGATLTDLRLPRMRLRTSFAARIRINRALDKANR